MRQNQNPKRSRGRGRRSGNSGQNNVNRNTTFESNGPEGRLRGNAQQLFEKYTALAHDAQTSGERVLFEAHSQFADHYYRIYQSILANAEQKRVNDERAQKRRHDLKANAEGEEVTEEAQTAEASAQEVVQEGDDVSSAEEAPSEEVSSEEAVSSTEENDAEVAVAS